MGRSRPTGRAASAAAVRARRSPSAAPAHLESSSVRAYGVADALCLRWMRHPPWGPDNNRLLSTGGEASHVVLATHSSQYACPKTARCAAALGEYGRYQQPNDERTDCFPCPCADILLSSVWAPSALFIARRVAWTSVWETEVLFSGATRTTSTAQGHASSACRGARSTLVRNFTAGYGH